MPLSNPSAKIRSPVPGVALEVGVCVGVALTVAVPVKVAVGDIGVLVDVQVAVGG